MPNSDIVKRLTQYRVGLPAHFVPVLYSIVVQLAVMKSHAEEFCYNSSERYWSAERQPAAEWKIFGFMKF